MLGAGLGVLLSKADLSTLLYASSVFSLSVLRFFALTTISFFKRHAAFFV